MDIIFLNRFKSYFLDILLFAIVLSGVLTLIDIGHLPLLLSQIQKYTFLNISLLSSLILLGYFQISHYKTSYYCWNFLVLFSFLLYLTNINAAWLSYSWYFMWALGCLFFLILCLFKKNILVLRQFSIYMSIPIFTSLSQYFLSLSGHHYPIVHDEFLMAIDGTLGIYPSLLVGQLSEYFPPLILNLINLIYLSLPLLVVFIFIKIHNKQLAIEMLIQIIGIGFIGYILYNIIPACGSKFAFHPGWPEQLPLSFLKNGPQYISCSTELPRNCVPSLHMAWIACLYRYSWLCSKNIRIFINICLIATCIAVFGIGAHYLVDLMVGLALANFIGGIFSFKTKIRWQAIIVGFILGLSWYILILYGYTLLKSSIFLSWSIFISALFFNLIIEYRLIRMLQASVDESLPRRFL